MKKIKRFLLVAPLFMQGILEASSDPPREQVLKPQSYLDIQGGYRIDSLKNTVNQIIQNNFKPERTITKFRELSIVTMGVKIQRAIYCHWYLKGFYSYGKVVSGENEEPGLYGSVKGHTYDGEIGLGYLTILNPHLGLAPTGGWGYNQQTMILRQANISEYNGLRFLSLWNGPWLGLDLVYNDLHQVAISLSYELHLTDWKGSWVVPQPIVGAYSDDRRINMAFGQVVYLDIMSTLIKHFNMLVELKYQYWSTQGGGDLYSRSDFFFTNQNNESIMIVNSVRKTVWRSFGVFLNIGYQF